MRNKWDKWTPEYGREGLQERIDKINADHRKEVKKIYGTIKNYKRLAKSR